MSSVLFLFFIVWLSVYIFIKIGIVSLMIVVIMIIRNEKGSKFFWYGWR